MLYQLLITACFLLSFNAAASNLREYTIKGVKIKIEVPSTPSGWQDAVDLFEVPLILLGPQHITEARPVISIDLLTKSAQKKMDHSIFFKDPNGYRKICESYLKKVKGTAIAYDVLKTETWPGITEANSTGFQYTLIGGRQFIEKTFYITCGKNLFHIKSLLRDFHTKEFATQVDHIIRTFSCE